MRCPCCSKSCKMTVGLWCHSNKELMKSGVTDFQHCLAMFVVFTWAVNNLLTAQVKTLLDQIDQCRSSSKDLTAKNKHILGRRSGHAHDTERRERTLAALKTEVQARAGALEENKRRLGWCQGEPEEEPAINLSSSNHTSYVFWMHISQGWGCQGRSWESPSIRAKLGWFPARQKSWSKQD